jgi:antitoxin (DNA-binding transcriptional repressor) of toxin-antitoxin stability system
LCHEVLLVEVRLAARYYCEDRSSKSIAMAIVTVPKADTELSDILARAEAGEEIILARDDKPVMKLVPIETVNAPVRGYGRFEHLRDEIPDDLRSSSRTFLEEDGRYRSACRLP